MKNNKFNHDKEIKEIQSLAGKFKNLHESIVFEDEVENQENQTENDADFEDDDYQEINQVDSLDNTTAIDRIRLICLDGLKELASKNQLKSKEFDTLNDIFSRCNNYAKDAMKSK